MSNISRRSFVLGSLGAFGALCLAACGDRQASAADRATAATTSEAKSPATPEATSPTTSAATTSATAGTSKYETGIHHAKIEVADYGTIEVELNAVIAPKTVANFAKLVEAKFYDGLTFHRIMKGFMIQGGDPNGNGSGGSGENVVGEFQQNGWPNTISHTRGTISMARANDPNSASSQFFICDADSTFLDGSYAAFGHVTKGMDVVDAIASDAKPTDNNGTIPADQQPHITSITMVD